MSNRHNRPNYLSSIVSVAMVLFLLGFFGLIILHAQQLITLFKEKVNVLVELKPNTNEMQIDSLQIFLEEATYVKPASVNFTSKAAAAELLAEEFGEQIMKLDLPNPFYDVISFNVKADYFSSEALSKIRTDLLERLEIRDVYYQENLLDEIGQNIRKLAWFALVFSLGFLIIAITLIHNTIRLALYSNRFIIKNMELVGASWSFISRPYLIRSLWHGILSGLLAISLLVLLLWSAQKVIPELTSLQNNGAFTLLFGMLLTLGVLITTLSTYFVVNKYLRLRVEEMY